MRETVGDSWDNMGLGIGYSRIQGLSVSLPGATS